MKDYANRTSTSTLREHLFTAHGISSNENDVDDEEASTSNDTKSKSKSGGYKQKKLSFKQKLVHFQPCSNKYELSRDLTVWAALDLEPFMFTHKNGARFFFGKNLPDIPLSSRNTLARTAFYDVYQSVVERMKAELKCIGGGTICVMFDGWTDKYRRYPFIGLRLAFVNDDWTFRLITVSLKVLDKHTGENMAAHVREELKNLDINLTDVEIFTTHDGAANMIKASNVLKSAGFQHCVAHALHLLLMTDALNKIADLVDLITRLKQAIQRVDAKCYLLNDAKLKAADRAKMALIQDKIAKAQEVLNADEQLSLSVSENTENDHDVNELEHVERVRKHQTLKTSIVTRWNSVLYMTDSALSLWEEMNDALKVNGDRELCMSDEDKNILIELKTFLKPFDDLTDLVSAEAPHLSLIPLVAREVKDAAKVHDGDTESIVLLKNTVLANADTRLCVSETAMVVSLLDPSVKRIIISEIGASEAKKILKQRAFKAVQRLHTYRQTKSQARPAKSEMSSSSQKRQIMSADSSMAGKSAAHEVGTTSQSESEITSKKQQLVKKHAPCTTSDDLELLIENEVSTYVSVSHEAAGSDESPLSFWKSQCGNFPHLSVLAKNYLCLSASSVGVEGMFSTAGLMLNCKRSLMAPYRANMLSVIHDNYSKYFPIRSNSVDCDSDSD